MRSRYRPSVPTRPPTAYEEFLASDDWARVRARARQRRRARRCAFHGRRCYLVQLHHWSRAFYRIKGHEAPWMLVALCDPTHKAAHTLARVLFGHPLRFLPVATAVVVGVGKVWQVVGWVVATVVGARR